MTIWAYAHILLLPLFIYLSIFKSAVQFSHCVILPADLQVIKLHMRISHTVFNHLHEGLGWSRYGSSYGYALRNTLTGVSTEGSVNPTDEQDDQEPNRTVLRMDWVTNALLRIKQNRNELNRRNKTASDSFASRIKAQKGKRRREGWDREVGDHTMAETDRSEWKRKKLVQCARGFRSAHLPGRRGWGAREGSGGDAAWWNGSRRNLRQRNRGGMWSWQLCAGLSERFVRTWRCGAWLLGENFRDFFSNGRLVTKFITLISWKSLISIINLLQEVYYRSTILSNHDIIRLIKN
jgi:hypothetical protein